jgi:hypothetical protein
MLKYKEGAVFFAVCGGKISEGIDFADDMARLVIIVGIPYGYLGDCRNKAKMEYLNKLTKYVTDERYKLSGGKWYELKAMRCISQSIGRVIRHKNDYGAIVFLDERMESRQRISQLSSWIQDQVVIEDSIVRVMGPLREFFRTRASESNRLTSKYEKEAIAENNNKEIDDDENQDKNDWSKMALAATSARETKNTGDDTSLPIRPNKRHFMSSSSSMTESQPRKKFQIPYKMPMGVSMENTTFFSTTEPSQVNTKKQERSSIPSSSNPNTISQYFVTKSAATPLKIKEPSNAIEPEKPTSIQKTCFDVEKPILEDENELQSTAIANKYTRNSTPNKQIESDNHIETVIHPSLNFQSKVRGRIGGEDTTKNKASLRRSMQGL